MPTKSNGPLLEDYRRALKAAKGAGVKAVRIEIGGSAMIFALDDDAISKLTSGQLARPNGEKPEPKLKW